MSVVLPSPTRAPAERFAQIIDTLCSAVAARAATHRLARPVLVLLWSWLRRTARRFGRLAARVQAGRPSRPRRPAAPRPPRPRAPRTPRLPRGFAWVIRLVPYAAAGSASQLQHLLAEPDMAALIAAAPTAGRLLRPLCRMLGVRLPPALILPLRPARRSATPARRAAARQGPPCGPPEPAPLAVVPSRAGPRRKLT